MAAHGAYIFGCEGIALKDDEKAFFRDNDPWGFILFARNLENPDQIRALTSELRQAVGRDAPVLIDQEGGRVARLRPPHWLDWLPALDQMEKVGPENGPRSMWIRYRLIAAELKALGIDTNCAPVADIPTEDVHPIIRNRCYGRDVGSVVAAGRAVADGLLAGGVLPVLKHIPGHGRPVADSHEELPRTDVDPETLWASDFAAFHQLNDLPMAMTAHVIYAVIDPESCATHSERMICLIREEIGFDGLLMTDDLSMSALTGSLADRSRKALDAGCDLILHCSGDIEEMGAVADESGRLSEAAQARAEAALAWRKKPLACDQQALLAELADLLC